MTTNTVTQEAFTVRQSAVILGTTPKTVYEIMKRGQLPYFRIGADRRITRDALNKLMGKDAGNDNL